MIYNAEEGLAAIMFPVEKVDVFAETEPGRHDRIAGKKAIINMDTRAVLSVCQWPSKGAHFWPSKSAHLGSVAAEGAKRPERGPMLGCGRPS